MPAINTEADDLNETQPDIQVNNHSDPSNKLFAKIDSRRQKDIKNALK